jgi:hypothetical protein
MGFLIHYSLRMLGVIFGTPSCTKYSAISSLPPEIAAYLAHCYSDRPFPLSQPATVSTES